MIGIFVLGDSISIQYGPFLERALGPHYAYRRKDGLAEAERDLDYPVGANGGDSSMCLAYLHERAADGDFRPDVLLLNCGLHDCKASPDFARHQVEPEDYRANLAAILAAIPAGTATVWIRTTPVDDELHARRNIHRREADVVAYNRIADEVMAAHPVRSVDLHAFTAGLGREAFTDGCHFTEPAQRQQGAYLAGHCHAWFGGDPR